MSNLYPITADTKSQAFLYGPFVIEESNEGWEWTHEDYDNRILEHMDRTGLCDTVFEAIEAADAWLEAQEQAA